MATFYVGLTMAGAISAGAYSAGVLDFLLEALEQWEQAKRDLRARNVAPNDWTVPSHDVVIPVMSGASAGAITAALGVVASAEQRADPSPQQFVLSQVGTVTSNLPRLYQAWVQMPCYVSATGGPDLLGVDDLKAGPVTSVLDTTLLQEILKVSFAGITQIAPPRPYFAETVHLFFSYTNLRGVPYEIKFAGGIPSAPGYPMLSHGDRLHYTITGLGSGTFTSTWAVPDPLRPLNTAGLAGGALPNPDWQGFGAASVGSSAFPVGLSARIIDGVTVGDYVNRQWPIAQAQSPRPNGNLFPLKPTFPPPLDGNPAARVDYVTSDGGAIDNEPFELARWTLMDDPPKPNPRLETDADRCVIMIDPFPEPPTYDLTGRLDNGLAAVIKALIPALINQARFKPDDMADTLNEAVFSRFLIAPRRRLGPNAALEPFGIACGLLGGFGGFLSEEFRAHDYQLGRLNCYLFLKNSFATSLANVVLKEGYSPQVPLPQFLAAKINAAEPNRYQVIPLVGTAAVQPAVPNWPRVSQGEVDAALDRLKLRADAVVDALRKREFRSQLVRFAVQFAWSVSGKGVVMNLARWTLMQDLIRRDQLDWAGAGASDDERKVLAALANPTWDFRTEIGIAAETGLDGATVAAALNKYVKLIASGPAANGRASYTLNERKPSWFSQLPLIKQADEFFLSGQPAID